MELQVQKHADKPHSLKYIRNNGTATWMAADDFFVLHDLSHFAIETTLGYPDAFMGLINNGMDIKDFEDREKRKRIAIGQHAWYAENMANLFLTECTQGNFEDFNKVLLEAFVPSAEIYPVPVLTIEQIEAVRHCLRSLIQSWKKLPHHDTLILKFDL